MRTNNTLKLLALTLAAALLPQGLRAAETVASSDPQSLSFTKPSDWSFEVTPFVWLASAGIETSVPQLGLVSPPSAQEFDTRFAGGLEFEAQAQYKAVGVLTEFNWLQLDTESTNPGKLFSGVNLRSDYIYSKAALTYELPLKGKFHAVLLAGASILNMDTHLKLEQGLLPPVYSDHSETVVAPLIGANLRFDLTKRWLLLARGTVGGFEGSNLQWDVFAGVGFAFSHWCIASLGYRYFGQDFSHDRFTLNMDTHGALMGLTLKF